MRFQSFVLILMLFGTTSCYTLEQGFRFNNSFNSRVSLREMLDDPELSPDKRAKLELAIRTLNFAAAQGLNVGDAYQFVIPETQKAVSYSVQAAEPDRLELLTWWFPFAGSVPYLGYFQAEKRDAKAKELRDQGYDVSEGTVGAFSSLGWFSDPLYFSMLRRPDPDVTQLLLHELVHRTFWSKGSASFNENLAEFVSLQMTEVYLRERKQEKDWLSLKESLAKQEIFRSWLLAMKTELTALYARTDLTKDQKIAQKADIIKTYQDSKFPAAIAKDYDGARKRPWNNASILGSTLYLPDIERFKSAYDCLKPPSAGAFLAALRESERRSKSADEALTRVCELKPKLLSE